MRKQIKSTGLALALLASAINAIAQNTTFTIQLHLDENGHPAFGSYDIVSQLHDLNGNVVSSVTNFAIPALNGVLNPSFNFGSEPFENRLARGVRLSVRASGSTNPFTALSPSLAINTVPYAIVADRLNGVLDPTNITPHSITTSQIATNQVVTSLNGLRDDVTLAPGANVAFSTNGQTITISADTGAGGGGGSIGWLLKGNAGTTAGVNFVGTTDAQPLELRAGGAPALRLEPGPLPNFIGGVPNIIGGDAAHNSVLFFGLGATIAGGTGHKIGSSEATIGGGSNNEIKASDATIAGGSTNLIDLGCSDATIGGGLLNTIEMNCPQATIAGGIGNEIANAVRWGTIGGGEFNLLSLAPGATIAGGAYNFVSAYAGAISGGVSNSIQNLASYSAIGGGRSNVISAGAAGSWIAGGETNQINGGAFDSVIGGGAANIIDRQADHATITGGYANFIDAAAHASTISGGEGNVIAEAVIYSAIGGGNGNRIASNIGSTEGCTIAGGEFNWTAGDGSAVGGGIWNTNYATTATIAGGKRNMILNGAGGAFIGGGFQNTIFSSAPGATIVGGNDNQIFEAAATASILGGHANQILSTAFDAVVAGGTGNTAQGKSSFAAGQFAQALHDNSFVWCDGSSPTQPFASTASRQFLILASRGVGINKNNPGIGTSLDVHGNINTDAAVLAQNLGVSNTINTAFLNATANVSVSGNVIAAGVICGTLCGNSDRNLKENFSPINSTEILRSVLGLPISTWSFKTDPETRHVGPMAQDFKAAFEVGIDDKHIATLDEGGVALAAIQGLNQKLEEQLKDRDARLTAQEQEITDLKKRLAALEKGAQ